MPRQFFLHTGNNGGLPNKQKSQLENCPDNFYTHIALFSPAKLLDRPNKTFSHRISLTKKNQNKETVRERESEAKKTKKSLETSLGAPPEILWQIFFFATAKRFLQ